MTTNHKIYYLLIFCLFPLSFLRAQSGVADQLLKATFHPSPQSAAYTRYGEYPVDYSTGVPKIEIPIYTLNTGDYELPISISYHASGIKVLDVSGPVGLGWTLNAGGVITRTVCGMPDYEGSNYRMFFKNMKDVERNLSQSAMEPMLWNRVFANAPEYDYESDRYGYNFAGKAGIFRYNVYNETPFTIPHEPIKIERTTNGYKITDTDGTTYYFEAKEYCTSPTLYNYTSAWYLTKIETAGRKNVITFSYTTGESYFIRYRSQFMHKGDEITYSQEIGQQYVVNEGRNCSGEETFMPTYIYRVPMLNSISWNSVNITFSYANDRLDTQKERLTSITVKDNSSTIKYVTFNNNMYFGGSTYNYRMKLGNLSIKGNVTDNMADNYVFSYDATTPPNHYNALAIGNSPKCYPIARIEGLTYSEVSMKIGERTISSMASGIAPTQVQMNNIRSLLPNALVTTYTYIPSVGIATETTPNGYKKTYSYDAMGRLKQIADTNGTVETYQYQYKQ